MQKFIFNPLSDCPVPFALIFGGTDLNEHHRDKEKFVTMSKAINKAKSLVTFSSSMKNQAMALWPNCEEKIILQAQAVSVEPSGFLFHDYFKQVIDAQKQHQISNGYLSRKHSGLTVFMLVAGLRRVKDPLYLAESISEWHKDDNSIHFVIVGPEVSRCLHFSTITSTWSPCSNAKLLRCCEQFNQWRNGICTFRVHGTWCSNTGTKHSWKLCCNKTQRDWYSLQFTWGICRTCQRVKEISYTSQVHNNECKKLCWWASLSRKGN